jgi:hypothetical protein
MFPTPLLKYNKKRLGPARRFVDHCAEIFTKTARHLTFQHKRLLKLRDLKHLRLLRCPEVGMEFRVREE